MELFINYLPFIVGVLPLLVAVVVALDYRQKPKYLFATLLLALTMLLGAYLMVLTYRGLTWHRVFTWFHQSNSPLSFRLLLSYNVDFPVAVMVGLTTTLNFIVHLYALAYMQTARKRYIVLTGGFVSAMLVFLMAENLWARFIGWELIGLGSYLFISFWYQQEIAAKNFTSTWIINQLGSMSLLIGILLIDSELGHASVLSELTKDVDSSNNWLAIAKYCLLGGIGIKSVQFPWFGWLSRAMTAPTPASALIHTATVVSAGIYLLIDLVPILDTAMLTWIAYWGSLTAFMGACAASAQQHPKQVLAYSTISQLGYVMMAVGVGASNVGLFHFITHAFCKACLLLCIGAVSRFKLQQNNVNAMKPIGSLSKLMPSTFCAYFLAACSLVGIPGSAGFLSKEAVLACTLSWAYQQAESGSYWGYLVPALGFLSSFLGIIYIGRQCYLVFMDTPRWSYKLAPSISYRTPRLMKSSMIASGLCSLGFWYELLGDSQNNWLVYQLAQTPRLASKLVITAKLQQGVAMISISTVALGLLVLITWKLRSSTNLLLPRIKLLLHGWYLNILTSAVARGGLYLSRLMAQFDHLVINGLVRVIGISYLALGNIISWLDQKLLSGTVLLIASIPRYLGKAHGITQQGNLQHSLLWIFLSIGLLWLGIYWITSTVTL